MPVVVLALTLAIGGSGLRLATPGLKITGLDANLSDPLTNHLAQSFTRLSLVTPRDMAALLGIERQKQLAGCASDEGSCMAELGNALGASGVVLGDLIKVGQRVQLNVRVIDPVSGKPTASYSEELGSADDALQALSRAAVSIESQLLGPVATRPSSSPRRFVWLPIAVGAGAAIAGAVVLGLAADLYARLAHGPPGTFTEDPRAAASRGNAMSTTGVVLLTASAVCLAAAAGLWLFAPRGEVEVVVVPAPSGVAVRGIF